MSARGGSATLDDVAVAAAPDQANGAHHRQLEFGVLGPFEVADRNRRLSLGGRKQRAVLLVLLLHRREVVTTDRLIDELWGASPPARALKTLQVYVCNLRRALGDGLLLTVGGGYLLAVEPGQVDCDRFDEKAWRGRQALDRGDACEARQLLGAALALWRGPALADFSYEGFALPEVARFEEARMVALEDRIGADMAAGQSGALVPELEALVHEHPLRERLYGQLMLALYRSGRQADALERYKRAHRRLVDEVGIGPGPQLTELEHAILNHDPALNASAAPEAIEGRVPPPTRRPRHDSGRAVGLLGSFRRLARRRVDIGEVMLVAATSVVIAGITVVALVAR